MERKNSKYNQEIKIPVKIIETRNIRTGISKQVSKIISCSVLIFSVIIAQTALFSGFEAHIINVSAHICNYSETRSCGYWKNHPGVYAPHLPQTLGGYPTDEIIDTVPKANTILKSCGACGCGCGPNMRNKLKAQLLAMKFNIAHFGIGEYFVESEDKTLNQIVADADNLLRNPNTPNPVLEAMKDLLDDLNNLHQIKFCSIRSDPEPGANIDVVINEFLPNPVGRDSARKPKGEWVELYNKGNEIDVAGWVLYDANDRHELVITPNKTNTGSTIIGPGGFLVVYRNGDLDFSLNNVGGDTVRLYNGKISSGATLVDSHTYKIDALEGKSFARIPDGSNDWVDPIPTPGESNVVGDEDIVFGPALPEEDEEIDVEIQNEISDSEIIQESVEQTPPEETPPEESPPPEATSTEIIIPETTTESTPTTTESTTTETTTTTTESETPQLPQIEETEQSNETTTESTP